MSVIDLTPPPAPARAVAEAGPAGYHQVLTVLVAASPLVAAALVLRETPRGPFPWTAVLLTAGFIVAIGHGVTGFHRLFAHRSFEANRPLKIMLAVLGSLSFQGSLIGWVADHRRHHRYSDRPGDPHSPRWTRNAETGGLRGLWHAHFAWCLTNPTTPRADYASDLLGDRDLVLIDRLFVPLCVVTLALPFGLGYLATGTIGGAIEALLWAGVLRIGITHNLTWSINSVCHRFGRRPFPAHDRSTNVAWLAPFTMGESWHNNHHAFPRPAGHGIDRWQLDTSAMLIRLFERLGWVVKVRWPDPALVAARRSM